jgi:hypothetical protein
MSARMPLLTRCPSCATQLKAADEKPHLMSRLATQRSDNYNYCCLCPCFTTPAWRTILP